MTYKKQDFKTFVYLLLISEAYDFIWLVNYITHWAIAGGIFSLVLWLSLIMFILKVPLGVISWRLSKEYEESLDLY